MIIVVVIPIVNYSKKRTNTLNSYLKFVLRYLKRRGNVKCFELECLIQGQSLMLIAGCIDSDQRAKKIAPNSCN